MCVGYRAWPNTTGTVYILKTYELKLSTGGSQSLPLQSEKWSSSGTSCGKGSVQVKCIKKGGKYFELTKCYLVNKNFNKNQRHCSAQQIHFFFYGKIGNSKNCHLQMWNGWKLKLTIFFSIKFLLGYYQLEPMFFDKQV